MGRLFQAQGQAGRAAHQGARSVWKTLQEPVLVGVAGFVAPLQHGVFTLPVAVQPQGGVAVDELVHIPAEGPEQPRL